MSDEYEVVWESGYVERLTASQVSWSGRGLALFSPAPSDVPQYIHFHDTIDDKWTLVLSAKEDDIRTIRNLTRILGDILEGEA